MKSQSGGAMGGRVKQYVEQHQLIAFFALTFAISWAAEFVFPHSNGFSSLGGYGPLFGAVLVTALLPSERHSGFIGQRVLLFCGAFALSMLVWVSMGIIPAAPKYDIWSGLIVSALFAWALSAFFSGRRSVRELLASLARWRVGWLPWIAIVVLAPMLVLFGVFVDLAMGGTLPALPLGAPSVGIFAAVFGIALLSGGGMEEVGWRGFALPRLQKQFNPLVASLIIGAIWALWHLPLYFNGQYTADSNTGPAALAGILLRFEWSLPLSVIYTWVSNRSRGSLLIMILFHTVFDWTTTVVPISYRAGAIMFMGTFWIVALILSLTDRMWRKAQPATPIDVSLQPQHATD